MTTNIKVRINNEDVVVKCHIAFDDKNYLLLKSTSPQTNRTYFKQNSSMIDSLREDKHWLLDRIERLINKTQLQNTIIKNLKADIKGMEAHIKDLESIVSDTKKQV